MDLKCVVEQGFHWNFPVNCTWLFAFFSIQIDWIVFIRVWFQEDFSLMINWLGQRLIWVTHTFIECMTNPFFSFLVRISRAIVRARDRIPIVSTRQLAAIVTAAVRNVRTDRFSRQLHPAARTFQALRILVNDELNELQCALKTAHKLLCPGGRLVVISFHALEDSIVRHFFKETHSEVSYLRSRTNVTGKAKTSTWLPLHKKVIYPSDEEVYLNPRSRSAKLRAAAKADNLVLDLTELTNLLDNNTGQTFHNGTSPL